MPGELHHGDNLALLRDVVADASVDLVYLDPPFASGRDYEALVAPTGQKERAYGKARPRADAFKDTWSWGDDARTAYEATAARDDGAGRAMRGLREILGEGDRLAYLAHMAPRLVELRRALKPTGSIYVHCDPASSHYLKVLMDAVFGAACFKNEIIWRYRRWPARARRFQRMHDVLLFYVARADDQHVFNTLFGYEKLAASTLKTFGTKRQRADFSSGHRKPAQDEEESKGPALSDVWEVGVIAPIAKERTGYPTQKPEALIERVILASTREGDVVLDPFAGSGTTLATAERLGRRWIGLDVSPVAIEIARRRLGLG